MLEALSAYNNTSVNWSQSQSQIMKLLSEKGIVDTQFTNVSFDTAQHAGLQMQKGTTALVLTFMKPKEVADGVKGVIPIRIIIPNIGDDEKMKNQAYRVFYWYLKSKFEAVDTGLMEFEQEFMAHIALGNRGGLGNVWGAFKDKMLPLILGGKEADIGLLESPKENKEEDEKD